MKVSIEKPKRPSARASDAVWEKYFAAKRKAERAEAAAKKILSSGTAKKGTPKKRATKKRRKR